MAGDKATTHKIAANFYTMVTIQTGESQWAGLRRQPGETDQQAVHSRRGYKLVPLEAKPEET